jgi:Zinc knuckle
VHPAVVIFKFKNLLLTLHKGDAQVRQPIADAHDRRPSRLANVPAGVLKAAEQWKTHISLTYLTDEFCNSSNASLTSCTHGILNHSQIDSFTHEMNLTYRSWELAINRLLDLLNLFFPNDAKIWHSFYAENYFGGKVPEDRWQIMLEYECALRREMLAGRGMVPDMEYHHFMALAEGNAFAKARKSLLAEAAKEATKLFDSRLASLPSQQSQGPSNDPGSTQQSFQGGRREDAAKTSKPERARKCFACGRPGHWADDCKATSQKNGSDILIKRNAASKWVLPNGKDKFCFGFNGESRCRRSPCTNGAHLCTLCSLGDHGAFYCPA